MKLNRVRIFGIFLFLATSTTGLIYNESNYGFLIGVLSAIGIMLIYYGRFNILRGIKK